MKKLKVGVLRETKTPPDMRVAIAPAQGVEFQKKFPNVELVIQPSDIRAYTNQEYEKLGLKMQEDLSDCDILVGVKEVEISKLIPNKTYLFFSHTAKKQLYNKPLLQSFLEKKIRLIDHEYLTDIHGIRLVAFGRWAGIVGAYNALIAYGKRYKSYNLRRAYECHDMDEFFVELDKVKLPNTKILVSGGGRVAHGAMEVLNHIGIEKVSPQNFLTKTYNHAVYAQIDPWHYTERKNGEEFDLEHFFKHPYEYKSAFLPFTKVADVFIACHFWSPQSPVFMTIDDMRANDFKIKIIADVSCDINGPIPSTTHASTIAEPFYGYNAANQTEGDAFAEDHISMMTVDNLPGESPRNASIDFGKGLIDKVFPSLLDEDSDGIIERASITTLEGKLGKHFTYLTEYAK